MLSTSSALFQPIKLGTLQLKHRVVLAPLARHRADENHEPTDLHIQYYTQRATEGGLLITEATFISDSAGAYRGAPGIYNDPMIQKWRKVTDAVHAKGGSIFVQIWHVGRVTGSALLPNNAQPVSASAIAVRLPNHYTDGSDYEVPRALEVEEISQIVQDFAQAAKNAMDAGFDGVEVHSANGFLLDQFTNTSSNKRTDHYGGSIENRCRFTIEVVKAVAEAIDAKRVGVRFSPWSEYNDMEEDQPYETWGYLIDQFQEHFPNLAYIHMVEPRDDFTRKTQNDTVNSLNPFRARWKGNFISAGGHTTNPAFAFEIADTNPNNLIAFGRAFIANPDLVYRLQNAVPLTKYIRDTFFTPGPKGYIDYPFADEELSSQKEYIA